MSQFDYSAVEQVAITKIGEFGRDVTLVRFGQGTSDPTQPWNGPAAPSASPDASLTVRAVFVQPQGINKLGKTVVDDELVKQSDQIALVATPVDFTADDLETYNELQDGTEKYRIVGVEKLKPGGTTLLYYVGVAR